MRAHPDRWPRISFGIIVLNGEPFTRYVLRSLYQFAHQIIVVEGAVPAARSIATADGHSRDGTLETLAQFKTAEDPENKVLIVTAEEEGRSNGFWPGEKDEQSRAYARRATGDYLWQVDIDEFYRKEEMEQVLARLRADPSITGMSFKQITFWGGLDYIVDGWYLRRGATYYHRLFRWRPGYTYAAHRPPTVLDASGVDLREGRWLDGETLARQGIHLYHYSLLLPKQVLDKCDYYSHADWADRSGALEWARDVFFALRRPFRVHNVYAYPSWLERYSGPHPDQATRMVQDLRLADEPMLRDTADIDRLLSSPWYRLRRLVLRALDPWERRGSDLRHRASTMTRRFARRVLG